MNRFPVRRVDKPWGWELVWAESETYAGKTLHIRAGEVLSLQFHQRKDETIHVLSGSVELDLQEEGGSREVAVLQAGQSVRIRPGTRHRLTALSACDVLEVSTPELDDVVRIEDRYGRV